MRKWLATLFLSVLAVGVTSVTAQDFGPRQLSFAQKKVLKNISPKGAHPGVVIASPSRQDPDYYYHWVRDAGITFLYIQDLYERTRKPLYRKMIHDFARFSLLNQKTSSPGDLGEPKYYVDGKPFVGPWGRPQNDGPALRAMVFIRHAHDLLDQGLKEEVRKKFYRAELPATSVIKKDLEYISHRWKEPTYDLWEELKGDHFYTRYVQWIALREGAALAFRMKDPGAQQWYARQASEIGNSLSAFWDAKRNRLVATRGRVEGLDTKASGLDSSILLAFLHGRMAQRKPMRVHPVRMNRLHQTVFQLEREFSKIYAVNGKGVGVAMGRYPEDTYYGGNPWVLTTAAFAEYYYLIAQDGMARGNLEAAARWMERGDLFMRRIAHHQNSDGSLSEQIHRSTGKMISARDLTWSYVAYATALEARLQVVHTP